MHGFEGVFGALDKAESVLDDRSALCFRSVHNEGAESCDANVRQGFKSMILSVWKFPDYTVKQTQGYQLNAKV